jgi:hypothetical protein
MLDDRTPVLREIIPNVADDMRETWPAHESAPTDTKEEYEVHPKIFLTNRSSIKLLFFLGGI